MTRHCKSPRLKRVACKTFIPWNAVEPILDMLSNPMGPPRPGQLPLLRGANVSTLRKHLRTTHYRLIKKNFPELSEHRTRQIARAIKLFCHELRSEAIRSASEVTKWAHNLPWPRGRQSTPPGTLQERRIQKARPRVAGFREQEKKIQSAETEETENPKSFAADKVGLSLRQIQRDIKLLRESQARRRRPRGDKR